jgi:FdhD protein
MESEPMHRPVEVVRWAAHESRPDTDALAVEEPLEIRLNGMSLAVTMRTPGQDEALAVGFLVTEGILSSPNDLYDVTRCADPDYPDLRNIVDVYVATECVPDDLLTGRQRYAASSCGLCGKASIEAVRKLAPPFQTTPAITPAVLQALPDRMRAAQQVFERTGGLHAAALFDVEGRLLEVEEDIGRHNAVDKVVGRAFLGGVWPAEDLILMASGRAGFEIVQKALVARIPVVCSVSAPSTLAVELAYESGMVLVGFLRGETMNVYAGELEGRGTRRASEFR